MVTNTRIILVVNGVLCIGDMSIPNVNSEKLGRAIRNVAARYGLAGYVQPVPGSEQTNRELSTFANAGQIQTTVYVTAGEQVSDARLDQDSVVVMKEVQWMGKLQDVDGHIDKGQSVLVVVKQVASQFPMSSGNGDDRQQQMSLPRLEAAVQGSPRGIQGPERDDRQPSVASILSRRPQQAQPGGDAQASRQQTPQGDRLPSTHSSLRQQTAQPGGINSRLPSTHSPVRQQIPAPSHQSRNPSKAPTANDDPLPNDHRSISRQPSTGHQHNDNSSPRPDSRASSKHDPAADWLQVPIPVLGSRAPSRTTQASQGANNDNSRRESVSRGRRSERQGSV